MRISPSWGAAQLLLLAILGPAARAAPLVDHFSAADGDAFVEAAVRALGDPDSSLEDRDYAVRLLAALDKPSVASGYRSSACSVAAAGLGSGDLEQIHHGITLADGVGGCANAKTWRASEEVADALKSSDLRSLYHATFAAPLLGADVTQGDTVLEKVLDLLGSDGSVRSYPSGPVEAGNTFMAAELLAVLVPSAKGDAKAIALREVEVMKDKVLGAEPALVVQLSRAAGDKKLVIKAAKLKSMARDLLEASRTSLPKSMLGVYEALKLIESYPKAPLPIKLRPSSPSVEELSSGGVSLLATSLLGSPAKIKSASLSSLSRADGSDASGDGDGGLGEPSADGFRALPSVDVAPGLYTAEFAVEVEGGEKPLVAKLPLAVSSTADLARARVSVSDSQERPRSVDASIESYLLARPGKDLLPEGAHASAVDGHHLHVELSLEGAAAAGAGGGGSAAAAPHQVFVCFTHVETGMDTFFVAAPLGGEASKFAVSVSLGEESQTFAQRSGEYAVTALVGGPLVAPPISERLGSIRLGFSEAKERKWPIYARPLLHETDVSLGPLPEKHHTFREPEVRPHAGVSLLFTALVLVPLAGLAYGMRRGGADLRRLPAAGAGRAWCAAYQACMVGVVLLFVTYWATLTMAYTLRVLAVLSVVTTVTGRKALQSLAVADEGARRATDSGSHIKGD
ncbi:unnamed protein product [Ectocarpus sp. 12 AP-2014]